MRVEDEINKSIYLRTKQNIGEERRYERERDFDRNVREEVLDREIEDKQKYEDLYEQYKVTNQLL